jgi:N-acetylneuraminate synthase/N,N'-diacetyllegionaminate synthase
VTGRTCVIAEAGVNHNGLLANALRLVDVASEAGADAVKFQTFKAESLVTSDAETPDYQKKVPGGGERQWEILKALELSFEDFARLKDYCDKRGIEFLSSPFDAESARFLVEDLGVGRLKIPSGEIVNLPFLAYLAAFGRPMILSTGMSDLAEVERAVGVIRSAAPTAPLTLLHCTTNYPCPFEDVNLTAMVTLKERFGLPVGYSDHTMGIEVAVAAVALGAEVVEKHFTLDRNLPGPDQRCSLEPEELAQMVRSIRNIERALGDGEKKPTAAELQIRERVRRSLVLTRPVAAGATLAPADLIAKRPGGGIPPADLDRVLGRRLRADKGADELLQWADLQ